MNGRDALAAKCRSMKGRLLTKEQYFALAGQPGLPEAVEYLKSSTAYSQLLADAEPTHIHRARLEQLLEKNLLDAYAKLYTFTSGNERKFFGLLIEEFTINYLLDAIRATDYDDSMEFYHIPSFIREHSKIDFTRIFRTDSKEEILAALKPSDYYDTLAPVMNDQTSFGDIESELVRAYYKKLMKKIPGLFSGEELCDILGAVHSRIDMINIAVILRMRRFRTLRGDSDSVSLELTEVFPRLIPIFGRLRESDISELCSANLSVADTISRFCEIERRPVFELDENSSTGEYGSRLIFARSKKLAGKSSAAAALGYLTLLGTETDNLIYILEALRYGLSKDSICAKLIV